MAKQNFLQTNLYRWYGGSLPPELTKEQAEMLINNVVMTLNKGTFEIEYDHEAQTWDYVIRFEKKND